MVPEGNIAHELESLGLTTYETRAYLTLLRRGSFSAAELSRVSEVPRQRIYDVIDMLVDKGLCQVRTDSPRTVAAISPTLAVAALAARRARELAAEGEMAQEIASGLTRSLEILHQKGQGQEGSPQYLSIYRDHSQIVTVAEELARASSKEIRMCLVGPSPFATGKSAEFLGDALERGVTCRALCSQVPTLGAEFGSLRSTYTDRGLTVRRLRTPLPGPRMLVFDRAAVLLFFPDPLAGSPSFQMLSVTHPQMLALMAFAFESLWGQEGARDLDAQGSPRSK